MSKEASVKSPLSRLDRANTAHIVKIFISCDRKGTPSIWGYLLRQQLLNLRIESSVEKAIHRGSITMTNNVRNCSLYS
jgi:hypothetical protein